MFYSVHASFRRSLVCFAAALCSISVLAGTAAAQTTVVLNQGGTQVTDTTIRAGSYENTNYDGGPLLTRRSLDTEPEWERRAILKFDTKNTIPQGTRIASATLTLTVKSGLGTGLRPIQAWRIPTPFQESEATWRIRQGTSTWSTPGGDYAEQIGGGAAAATAGSRVTFDLTAAVQRIVNGDYDSRYTRVLLTDGDQPSKESYREYYSSEESTVSRRPTLTVILGSTTSTSTGTTLKVLQWNIAQGYGTDGRSNIDRVVDWVVTADPDLISFNEIMKYSTNNQPQMIVDRLRARTGEPWNFHWAQISGASSGIGVAVLSRFPIEDRDSYLLSYDRSVAMIAVTVNNRRVHFFSTHLDHQYSSRRILQVGQLKAWASTFSEQRIIAGDFNWYPGTTEINEMCETYYDGWAVAMSRGTAVSYAGNPDGNTRNNRIDYVFSSKGASALYISGARVYDTGSTSDHKPVMVTYRVN